MHPPRSLAPILVEPVEGFPGLAEAMPPALEREDIVASTTVAGPTVMALRGRVDGDGPVRGLIWRLIASDGRLLGQFRQPLPSNMGGAETPVVAQQSATGLARLLRGDNGRAPAPVRKPRVIVRAVHVSGSLDAAALTENMSGALARQGFAVTGSDGPAFLVDGEVRISRGAGDQDMVQVDWIVRNGLGKELGTVSQASPVAHDLLVGETRPLVRQIAIAGSFGVAEVIQKSRPLTK